MDEIKKIINTGKVLSHKDLIDYHTKKIKLFPIYEVDINDLKYNKGNTRLADQDFSDELILPDYSNDLQKKIQNAIAGQPISDKMKKLGQDIIKKRGIINPLVILNDGVIVSGNRRFTALLLIKNGKIKHPDGEEININDYLTTKAVVIEDSDSTDPKVVAHYEINEQNDPFKDDYNIIAKALGIYEKINNNIMSKKELMQKWQMNPQKFNEMINRAKIMLKFLEKINEKDKKPILSELKIDAVVQDMAKGTVAQMFINDANFSRNFIIFVKNILSSGKGANEVTRKLLKNKKILKSRDVRNHFEKIVKDCLHLEKIIKKINSSETYKEKANSLVSTLNDEEREKLNYEYKELVSEILASNEKESRIKKLKDFYKYVDNKLLSVRNQMESDEIQYIREIITKLKELAND